MGIPPALKARLVCGWHGVNAALTSNQRRNFLQFP
jgi:hypothetical protein